jgi:hypothetical protein
MRKALGVILLFFIGSAQAALVKYSYEGEALIEGPFISPSGMNKVTATFILDDAYFDYGSYDFKHCPASACESYTAGMIDWTISDGATSYSFNDDYRSAVLRLHLDVDGGIQYYDFEVVAESFFDDTLAVGENFLIGANDGGGDQVSYCVAVSANADGICEYGSPMLVTAGSGPGTWTVTAVPLPPAVWLFGSALAGLGWMRRRKTF